MVGRGLAQHRQGRWIAALAALLALAALVAGIWINAGGPAAPQPAAGPAAHQPAAAGQSATSPSGAGSGTSATGKPSSGHGAGAAQLVGLRLSAGRAQQPATPVAVVDGRPLGADRVAAILARLSKWSGDDDLAAPFRWPTQTTPAPRAGTTVTIPFPGKSDPGAPETPGTPQTGPLHVLRTQPQGAVAIAPFLSITFDQPMVPIATVGQLAKSHVPATISPKLAGTWQWIGTSTLRFAADSDEFDRLPMATEYTVTVPAGTRAAGGGTLAADATFTFSTPPPTVKHLEPTGPGMQAGTGLRRRIRPAGRPAGRPRTHHAHRRRHIVAGPPGHPGRGGRRPGGVRGCGRGPGRPGAGIPPGPRPAHRRSGRGDVRGRHAVRGRSAHHQHIHHVHRADLCSAPADQYRLRWQPV